MGPISGVPIPSDVESEESDGESEVLLPEVSDAASSPEYQDEILDEEEEMYREEVEVFLRSRIDSVDL